MRAYVYLSLSASFVKRKSIGLLTTTIIHDNIQQTITLGYSRALTETAFAVFYLFRNARARRWNLKAMDLIRPSGTNATQYEHR